MKRVFTLILLILFILPVAVLLLSVSGSEWTYPAILPGQFGLNTLGGSSLMAILPHVFSSVLYSVVTVLTTILISILPAKYLAYSSFKNKNLFEIILLLPAVVSPFTFLMGVQFISLKLGIGNSSFSVILILSIVSYPYMLRAFIGGYSQLDRNIMVCARNLGGSRLTALFKVEFPLILPSIVAGANIVFLIAFADYFLVFVMGSSGVKSLALMIFPLLTSSSRQITSFYNLFFLIIPLILFALMDGFLLNFYRRRKMQL
ncbi:MAG: ABC transporter permease subunit [Spirochaetales bacterium]|nr:ABC transporter permease subunit [Spirochaetales bacterium]